MGGQEVKLDADTMAAVRKAFWATFHQSGEHWFPYPNMGADPEYCEEITEEAWRELLEHLALAIGEPLEKES